MSVVLSVYNGGAYLAEAVESVLSQTYADFELVAIDDGSTDGSGAVLDGYAERDGRVRVLHQENRGLIASLNRGVEASRGALVARMDADDVALPDRLQKQVDYLDQHPEVGLLGGIARYIDASGEDAGGAWPRWYPPALNAWRTLFETVLCHPTVVIRRSVLDAVGVYDPAALHAEDYELWTRAIFHTRIANLPDPVLYRRKWEGTVGEVHSDRQERTVSDAVQAVQSRLLGRPVDREIAVAARGLATRRPVSPDANLGAVSRHVAALCRAFRTVWGGRVPEVEADALDLLMAAARLARARGESPLGPSLTAARLNPRGVTAKVWRRVAS